MKTNLKIFDEIIKNLDNINSLSFESYKNYSLKFPVNYESGNPYNGVNAFNLLFFSLANGFDLEYFLTINQLKNIGNADFKGQKTTAIKFFKDYYQDLRNKKNKISKLEFTELTEVEKKNFEYRVIINHSNVLNLQQLNNLEDLNFTFNSEESRRNKNLELIEKAEIFISDLKENKGLELYSTKVNNAKYSVTKDRIIVPLYDDFKNESHYYNTFFHELIHWSGSESRLNRFHKNGGNNFNYNFEEFIAEIGSILLMIHFKVESNIYNSIAYIKMYLKNYKEEDKVNVLRDAFKEAEKAVDFLTK